MHYMWRDYRWWNTWRNFEYIEKNRKSHKIAENILETIGPECQPESMVEFFRSTGTRIKIIR